MIFLKLKVQLFIVFIFSSLFIFSQQIILSEHNITLIGSYQISEKKEINALKDTIIKGYYKNDSLAYSYKLYHNKPSGRYSVYHLNGQKKYSGVFMNGKLHGLWMEFDEHKKLVISGYYDMGRKDGSWYYFKDKKVEVYRNGIARGRWRIDEGWTPRTLYKYENGVLVKTKRHWKKDNIFD